MSENQKADGIERRLRLLRHEQSHEDAIELLAARIPTGSTVHALWNDLSKRRWEILTTAVLASFVAAIYSFSARPVYRATAQVEIDAEEPQTPSIDYAFRSVPTDVIFLKTQADVLESDNLAGQTIQQLRLAANAEFFLQEKNGEDPSSLASQAEVLKQFRKRLIVTFLPNSRIIGVGFESADPDLAARIVNALIANYVEYNFRKKYDATHQVGEWMEQQLEALKAKVEKSQQALVDYEREHAIVNVSEKQSVAEERLADLTKDLTASESERLQKESLYNLLKPTHGQVGLITQDELLQRLEEKYSDLNSEYVAALGEYGPNYPKVKILHDQTKELQSLIDSQSQRVVERIRNEFDAAVGREQLLSMSVARAKDEVGRMNQLLIQHNILQREFDTNQQLYASLLQRLKDAAVSAGLRATNIHVLDPAVTPAYPVRPKKLLNITAGFVIGALLGILLAFVQESLDVSVKTVEHAEALINAPSLAMIPAANSSQFHQYGFLKRREAGSGNGVAALAVLKDPGSPQAEAYRALRTAVLLSTASRPPQTLLVTSSHPGEGKTCTSLNLAAALAKAGSGVLIVDADLRKPQIAGLLGVSNDKGLSGVLTGAYSFDKALQTVDFLPNFSVLPAGPHPPNPADLFSSSSMKGIFQDLRGRFEHIVIDSPPSLLVADATILSALVDGVIVVVEGGVTPAKELIRSYRILEASGARILGTVLNKVDLRQNGYRGYYGYYANGQDSAAGQHLKPQYQPPGSAPQQSTAYYANGQDSAAGQHLKPQYQPTGTPPQQSITYSANGQDSGAEQHLKPKYQPTDSPPQQSTDQLSITGVAGAAPTVAVPRFEGVEESRSGGRALLLGTLVTLLIIEGWVAYSPKGEIQKFVREVGSRLAPAASPTTALPENGGTESAAAAANSRPLGDVSKAHQPPRKSKTSSSLLAPASQSPTERSGAVQKRLKSSATALTTSLPASGSALVVVGILKVETVPPGATLYVDGKSQGTCPCRAEVSAGRHQYRVELRDYLPYEGTADLAAGTTVGYAVKLAAAGGTADLVGTQ
jgi:capsular exopolysaccharide synthesis family protein